MSTKRKPNTGIMIAKAAFGLMFIAIGIAPDPEFDASARSVSIIIGLAILAWTYIPYRNWKAAKKAALQEIEKQEKEIAQMKEILKNKPRRCPHCGANTKGSVCEYCGSVLADTK